MLIDFRVAHPDIPAPPPVERFRRSVLLFVIVAGLLGTLAGWYVASASGRLSPTLAAVQQVTAVVLAALWMAAWWRWLPQHLLELCCLLYVVAVCVVCMGLRMYSPTYGAGIELEPLFVWMPLVYLFAFMLSGHRSGLFLSLAILALFVGISLPYLAMHLDGRYANLTIQSHVASAVMVAVLYFFSGYQQRLRQAQLTVDQLAHLSSTDELTGLCNRRHMAAAVGEELSRCAAGGAGFAVMLFDVDHFKAVNDELGHGAGDRTLVALAACARNELGHAGVLGRWGGDEFLALVRRAGFAGAVRSADALCARVAATPIAGGRRVTISCGVTVARVDDNIDSLLQRADAALYAAKHDGRNRARGLRESH